MIDNVSVHGRGIWSVGLLRSSSLEGLASSTLQNPIVSAHDFAEWNGKAVADPFAVYRNGVWYLFFELFLHNTQNAVIGASRSRDLVNWEPLGIVLKQPHHLSYPFVFEHDGQVYMMPESKSAKRVDLFRAVEFPYRWELEKTILRGRFMDCSMVQHAGRFWLFAGWRSYSLKLFHARSPLGPWRPHWLPCLHVDSKTAARPGGRPLTHDGKLIRFSQDCRKCYGHQLRAWHVTKMNRLWYSEKSLCREPILSGSGAGWNAECMHHIDAHRVCGVNGDVSGQKDWLAFVDGCA